MIKEMLKQQQEVDQLIAEKFDGDFKTTLSKRIIAFKVEVSEFANEIGSFKYWKESHVRNKERILDEGADCLAFLFSIVNSYELGKRFYRLVKCREEDNYDGWKYEDWRINQEIKYLLEVEIEQDADTLSEVYNSILSIVEMIGYSSEDLKTQYFTKSQENLYRARNGY